MKDELIKYLRHLGNDVVPDDVVAWAECEGQGEQDEDGYGHCPKHRDCGICRFEYMKRKGWLAPEATQQK